MVRNNRMMPSFDHRTRSVTNIISTVVEEEEEEEEGDREDDSVVEIHDTTSQEDDVLDTETTGEAITAALKNCSLRRMSLQEIPVVPQATVDDATAASNSLKDYAKRRGSVDAMSPAISALQAYATRRASVQESYARTLGSAHETHPTVSAPKTTEEVSADALQDYRRRHALLMEHYANERRAEKTALSNVVPPTKLSKARSALESYGKRRASIIDSFIEVRKNSRDTPVVVDLNRNRMPQRRMSTDDMFNAIESMRNTQKESNGKPNVDHSQSSHDDELQYHTHNRLINNMNYHVIIIFHADTERRPCQPVVKVVTLKTTPATGTVAGVGAEAGAGTGGGAGGWTVGEQKDIGPDLKGVHTRTDIITTCQLCDSCVGSDYHTSIDPQKLLCVYAMSITDTEANDMIGNVASINAILFGNRTTISERSNFALLPRALHRFVQHVCMRSIKQLRTASRSTDVQLCILLLRESLNHARSINAKLRALHPYLTTPENLHDAIDTFTRPLDTSAFKKGVFRFEKR